MTRRKASQKFYGDKAKQKALAFLKEYSERGKIVAVEMQLQYDEKSEVKKVGTRN